MARLNLWAFPTVFLLLTFLYLLAQQHEVLGVFDSFSSNQVHSFEPNSHKSLHAVLPVGSRLNLTLAANELRYQAAVRQRNMSIERLGGPNALAVIQIPTTQYCCLHTLGFIRPAFSCPFPVYRVGTMGDGGKWICGLERATHHRNCVIYSMGVERQSSFEQEVLRQSPDCQVYGFDYSVSQWGPELLADIEVNGRAHFFPYKIGAVDNHDVTPKEYSLQGIMKELGHDFIDIWKIDIEGSEFSALTAVIESFKGKPLPFGQMQIEIHLNFAPTHPDLVLVIDIDRVGTFDKWWTMLEDAGLRPFWTELNLLDVNVIRRGPFVGEWSFINIRGKHPLIDDSLPDYP
ncbi:methyltransferase domain-containing protein [Mycena leptocephala]|nr:methyltransferase domain-containing protein [Mycena leptocephala]